MASHGILPAYGDPLLGWLLRMMLLMPLSLLLCYLQRYTLI
jgi:hypothetical protein